ncbi:MAG: alpha/beta hydrolase, partial [Candidatus Sericytochromatia bacterium]|nr:alpha/beta hydrolase [Candidatus Sericytochromatia bacterium]
MNSKFVKANNINLHYLDFSGENPPIILTHGVTANAHAFDGLINSGLNNKKRVISIDLRGRGLSDKPITGYS